ncbi:metallophosphoesterase [Deinococcus marmoris]|uniref:Serine/threonine protein phosphatase n=1 Tax=Deinococcus marmoris TaxID=249408 RepID=A0A1U7P4V6_9DEIO|nr:metallophosphoesterase [Deinococcus marmoris]OLV20207.1 Serine/threonine protein phosphatase [Deinococcus marmoris]
MNTLPIVIGDIHGRLDLLRLALDRFPHRPVVFIGDLVDRGFESRGVVGLVRALAAAGRAQLCLGNHEEMLITAVLKGRARDHWLDNGGQATLDSYGGDSADLEDDAQWLLEHARPWIQRGHVLFAHAMRPDPSDQDEDIHLWGRPGEAPLHRLRPGVSHSVHGHTPMERPVSLQAPDGTVAWFIDTGAFHTGVLCALDTADWTPHLIRLEEQDGST